METNHYLVVSKIEGEGSYPTYEEWKLFGEY